MDSKSNEAHGKVGSVDAAWDNGGGTAQIFSASWALFGSSSGRWVGVLPVFIAWMPNAINTNRQVLCYVAKYHDVDSHNR